MKCRITFERPFPHSPIGSSFKDYCGDLTDGILWVTKAGPHAVNGKWGIHLATKAIIVPEGAPAPERLPPPVAVPKAKLPKAPAVLKGEA